MHRQESRESLMGPSSKTSRSMSLLGAAWPSCSGQEAGKDDASQARPKACPREISP